ncbi:hypothetical protein [Spiroplasma tabanidicola]|uniref:Uncharacterized protein n=1 Tax=Spiroplasma tabanidicola TaxID=324079 RepID=A0A6I6CDP0_9MOLU|nr:hypothetical protein [Spiroplasma tabanidicola]QGS52094.1 hypothetical protein STABA_v1c07380 [Spiroplasma tabanidicola]
MKLFTNFLIKLKPYQRLYKMFWLSFTLVCLYLFQFFMLIFSMIVPHIESGFKYYVFGFYALFGKSLVEPNAAHGFIFAAGVALVPVIIIVPILYFVSVRWLIEEVLSDKFINVPKDEYLKWSKFIHYSILAGSFILIPGLFSYIGGGGILPHKTFLAILGTFGDNYLKHVAGIFAFLYYGVGCFYSVVVFGWGIGIGCAYVFKKINIVIEKWKASYYEKKDQKRIEKLEKKRKK